MVDLAFHDMLWCPWGGHPVLVLEAKDHQVCFAVSVSADDARALSAVPHGVGATRARGLSMLTEAITRLGARLIDVTLGFGPGGVLCAEIGLATAADRLTLSSHFSDGLILARHTSAPLRMTDATFAQIDATTFSLATKVPGPIPAEGAPAAMHEPFRSFIESLDLSDVDGSWPRAEKDAGD
ncbi:MAG: bifunctional nuclease domain-containing protein [Thermomicrobiales bacterium]